MDKSVSLKAALFTAIAVFLSACGSGSNSESLATNTAGIQLVSSRADLVADDEALVDVAPPEGVAADSFKVSLNGHEVTDHFILTDTGTLRGLVTGLRPGDNTLVAKYSKGQYETTLVNHPSGDPIIAGPQLHPWTCQQGALDDKCNQAPVYSWYYISTSKLKSGFQPYDPKNPPKDVATTTTDDGITVPFIVREETGYEDRDQYKIAVLYQPDKPWTAVSPQDQFNHKLLITHGASCGVDYRPDSAPSVLSYAPANLGEIGGITIPIPPTIAPDSALYALGAGFATLSTALDNSGHNCNVALQAESLLIAKSHFIANYGTLRYTIGTGCSGGSLAQQQIANAYPGIYQGLLPTCSFPDAWSTATQFVDYHLLIAYFNDPSAWADGIHWSESEQAAVMGRNATLNAYVSDAAQFHVAVPTDPCSGTTDQNRYDPVSNPSGIRCTITDAAINILGPRPSEIWTAAETAAGHGFAGFPLDNIGVQYGLQALQQGVITPAQFVDLNQKIGGLDVDTHPIPQRVAAVEPALTNAYRSGMINETTNLDQAAIIDCRGPDPGFFHDSYRAFAIRARLDREHGTHANQLIWEGPFLIIGDTHCNQTSLVAMDRWLSSIEQDNRDIPLSSKIVEDKPADLDDECWNGGGKKVSDGLCGPDVVPIYGTPRMVAGDAITTDTNKCQLKALNRDDDYGPKAFTDAQWSQLEALFPRGVCDFSKPGVDQQPTIPWQTYQESTGSVIYGGHSLPAMQTNSQTGWTSRAFLGTAS